jgi:hypothetical protein
MLALVLAREKGVLSQEECCTKAKALAAIPDAIAAMLPTMTQQCRELAKAYRYASSFLYLGRGFNFPVALEGALKAAIAAGGPHLIEVPVGKMPSPWSLLRLRNRGGAADPDAPGVRGVTA